MGYPTYDHAEFIAAYDDFLAFAAKMYLDYSAYERPPSTGWPQITIDSMRKLGKTDEVVELLRWLPYPKATNGWDPEKRPQVMPAMAFAAWHTESPVYDDESAARVRGHTEGYGIYEDVPATVVGLCSRRPNDHGVLLDTKLGVVFWLDAAGECKWFSPFQTVGGEVENLLDPDLDGEEEDDDDKADDMLEAEKNWDEERRRVMSAGEREWRLCDTVWDIPDFFATLKHMFTELHFVPMSRWRVVDGWHPPESHGQAAVDMVKGIYREHGWPDLDRYRKQDCLKAIHAALKDNFPDEVYTDDEGDEDYGELLAGSS